MRTIIFLLWLLLALYACYPTPTAWRLYRTSLVAGIERVHVATFDVSDGEEYNRDNCRIAADMFRREAKVEIAYWCEKVSDWKLRLR